MVACESEGSKVLPCLHKPRLEEAEQYYELSSSPHPLSLPSLGVLAPLKMAWFERIWGERRDFIKAVDQTICTSWYDWGVAMAE